MTLTEFVVLPLSSSSLKDNLPERFKWRSAVIMIIVVIGLTMELSSKRIYWLAPFKQKAR